MHNTESMSLCESALTYHACRLQLFDSATSEVVEKHQIDLQRHTPKEE